jgi:hypothetical protein
MTNEKATNNPTAADNDSEEEDEDYVPPTNASDDEGNAAAIASVQPTESQVSILAPHQKKAVDDAFQSLFPTSATNHTTATSTKNNKKKKKKAISKKSMRKKKILSDIFGGSSIASKLMETSGSTLAAHGSSKRRSVPLPTLETKVVTETKRFAGQHIQIQRTVVEAVGVGGKDGTDGKTLSSQAAKPSAGGIDSVLSQIAGPQKISTMTKTNADWDTFKDKTGINDELTEKAEGKDAYLVKQDFLQRVDQRRFEQEKVERDRTRVKAAASKP